jgi:hypothetical protein
MATFGFRVIQMSLQMLTFQTKFKTWYTKCSSLPFPWPVTILFLAISNHDIQSVFHESHHPWWLKSKSAFRFHNLFMSDFSESAFSQFTFDFLLRLFLNIFRRFTQSFMIRYPEQSHKLASLLPEHGYLHLPTLWWEMQPQICNQWNRTGQIENEAHKADGITLSLCRCRNGRVAVNRRLAQAKW